MERITKAATKQAVQMQTKHLFDTKPAHSKTEVRQHKKIKKHVIRSMQLNQKPSMLLPSMAARQVIVAPTTMSNLKLAQKRNVKASEMKTKLAQKLSSVEVVDTWAMRKAAADKAAMQGVRNRSPPTMRLSAEQLKNAAQLRKRLEAENPPAYVTGPPPRSQFAPYVHH